MQLPLLKSELFTVLWDHITRDQHTRYFAPKNFSFLLDSWVTCTVVTVVIAAVFVLFLIYVAESNILVLCHELSFMRHLQCEFISFAKKILLQVQKERKIKSE